VAPEAPVAELVSDAADVPYDTTDVDASFVVHDTVADVEDGAAATEEITGGVVSGGAATSENTTST
jgi:hypothetical protein